MPPKGDPESWFKPPTDPSADQAQLQVLLTEAQKPADRRSVKQLDAQALSNIKLALKEIEWGATASNSFILRQGEVTKLDPKKIPDSHKADFKAKCHVFFKGIAFSKGTLNKDRYWIRVTNNMSDGAINRYVALPLLATEGKHAALPQFYRKHISAHIKLGLDTTMLLFMKRKGVKLEDDSRVWVHSRSYHDLPEGPDRAQQIADLRDDLSIIFTGMQIDKESEGKSEFTPVFKYLKLVAEAEPEIA
jgi:hypothetical protein